MGLIDILPEFRSKPIDISPWTTKLAPKKTEASLSESVPTEVKKPAEEAIPKVITKPIETITKDTPSQTITNRLPEKYSAMKPLADALDETDIATEDAKLAVLAQMGLEKGWKTPSDYSYGNIVAGSSWTGKIREGKDKNAAGQTIIQKFRSYNSPQEFVADYIDLLKRNYPQAYDSLKSSTFSIDKFTDGLTKGKLKYAEDKTYKNSLTNVFNSVKQNFSKNI